MSIALAGLDQIDPGPINNLDLVGASAISTDQLLEASG